MQSWNSRTPTIISFIAGDNGSSAEGGIEGSLANMFFNGFPEKAAGQSQSH